MWDGVSFLELSVKPKYQNQLCGLCGNFNGNRYDDFYGRHGLIHSNGQDFGDTWRVGGLRACSVLPRDMPKHYEPQCTQSWESKIKSDKNCNALYSDLFSKCEGKVDASYYYNACKLDVCECPGETCHCEVLIAYARECERATGTPVYNWRQATGCVNVSSFQWSHSFQSDEASSASTNDSRSKNEVLSLTSTLIGNDDNFDSNTEVAKPQWVKVINNGRTDKELSNIVKDGSEGKRLQDRSHL